MTDMRTIATLALCIALIAPIAAWAQARDPLNYPLRQYAVVLVTDFIR